jgi:hypothetical protein
LSLRLVDENKTRMKTGPLLELREFPAHEVTIDYDEEWAAGSDRRDFVSSRRRLSRVRDEICATVTEVRAMASSRHANGSQLPGALRISRLARRRGPWENGLSFLGEWRTNAERYGGCG